MTHPAIPPVPEMATAPERVLVLGSGAGALSSATEFALAGVQVTVADSERFRSNIDAIAQRGHIRLKTPWHGITEAPARASLDPAAEIRAAEVIVVVVPGFGHDAVAALVAQHASDGSQVIFAGEGGGCLALGAALASRARAAESVPRIEMAELNSLPYGTRVRAPGLVTASRKSAGTIAAGMPGGTRAVATAAALWPSVSPAQNVLETILLNFNAIDHVPPILCNLGAIESGPGKFLLWGTGASPGVCRIIESIDRELRSVRAAFGFANTKGYEEYLVEQGFAPVNRNDLYATLQSSAFADSTFATGPDALGSRYITEDVPYALTLMASIGYEAQVPTPTIDAVIRLVSVVTGEDYATLGRTLATFGLAGLGRAGLLAATSDGWWT